MVDSTAISIQNFLILMPDQFSQRRKMRLERANLRKKFLKGKKCHLLGEFSPILGSKRLVAVCTTVVQLGILRLK